jgi:hypothetical protein
LLGGKARILGQCESVESEDIFKVFDHTEDKELLRVIIDEILHTFLCRPT